MEPIDSTQIERWESTIKTLKALQHLKSLKQARLELSLNESDSNRLQQSIPQHLNQMKNLKLNDTKLNKELNSKISLFSCNIVLLKIEAIVNAANALLTPGGGVSGHIHEAGGKQLTDACAQLGSCNVGECKLTLGYKLPAKYVIHAVAPSNQDHKLLKTCYQNVLKMVKEKGIRSVGIVCLGCGKFGFPSIEAAHIALQTVREWLIENKDAIDHILFDCKAPKDHQIYEELMQIYFPE